MQGVFCCLRSSSFLSFLAVMRICMRSDDNLCVSQSCAGSRWVSLVAVNAIKTRLPKNVLHIPLHSDSQGRAHLQTLP